MRCDRRSFLALCILQLTTSGMASSATGPSLTEQIERTAFEVRSGKTLDIRTDAAEHIERLTQKVGSKEVTDMLVTTLISLLDSPDDSVQYWIARALGNLGPSAKAAVPKLEQMLPKAACVIGVITSVGGIRYALIKMGVKPPPSPKCEGPGGFIG